MTLFSESGTPVLLLTRPEREPCEEWKLRLTPKRVMLSFVGTLFSSSYLRV